MNKNVLNKIADLIKGSIFEGKTYLVGGSVRDYVMGKASNDYDLTVEMEDGGIQLANYLIQNYPNECGGYAIFPTYGTAKLTINVDGIKEDIEIVETRCERYDNINSRNPSCVYGSLTDDCFRRDLTINSLYMDISTLEILDLTKMGLRDINDKIIRTPCDPNITFSDDPLRMLRCIRFASRYNWSIEENTLKGIKDNAYRINIVSKERIATEISKILVQDNVRLSLTLLKETGLLCIIIPEFEKTFGLGQNEFHDLDVWGHTLDVVEKTPKILTCRVAALFHDLGKINTRSVGDDGRLHFYKHEVESSKLASKIMKANKCPNDIIHEVTVIVENHMRTKSFKDDVNVSDKVLRKLKCDMGDLLDKFLHVVDADNKSHSVKGIMPNQVDNIRKRYLEMSDNNSDVSKVILPINGNDVLETLKIAPGPIVKCVLSYVTDMYLENPNITKEECIKLIESYEIDK